MAVSLETFMGGRNSCFKDENKCWDYKNLLEENAQILWVEITVGPN